MQPNVLAIRQVPPMPGQDDYRYAALVADPEGGEDIPVILAVSATTSITAGFGEDGPPAWWVGEQFARQAELRLDPGLALRPQASAWESPFIVRDTTGER